MKFDTKIAVVVRNDLASWQALNVTSFLTSGIAGAVPLTGEDYRDASGKSYLPLFRQPVLIFAGDLVDLRRALEVCDQRDLATSIYTYEMFSTGHDAANRAVVRAVATKDLDLVGIATFGRRKAVDRAMSGLRLHP